MSLEGPKSLRESFSPGYWSTGIQYGDWENITPNPNSWWLQEGRIDLTGLASEELTTFLSMVDIQRSGLYASLDPDATTLSEYILITDTPWFKGDIISFVAAQVTTFFAAPPPGFLYATDAGTSEPLPSWVNVLYGEFNLMAVQQQVSNAMVRTYSTTWGSGGATASDTIYIYRLCPLSGQASGQIVIPGLNVVLGVVVGKEADLAYIERLRRSYILQEGRDVDLP